MAQFDDEACRATGPIERVVISTDDVDPPVRFEAWRDRFMAVNDVQIARDAEPGFEARSEQWRLGPFLLGVNTTPARQLVRTGTQCSRDGLDHWVIQMSPDARGVVRANGRTHLCRPGTVNVVSLGESYVEDWTSGNWVGLIFPRGAFPDLTSRLEVLGFGPLPSSAANALLADYLLSLSVRLPVATAHQIPAFADMTRAILNGCVPDVAAPASDSDRVGDLVRRAEVERVIRRNIGSARLDVSRLCALARVSRSTLYRIFESEGGVAAYIRRLRLGLVDEDLRNPDLGGETVASLAQQRGFHCAASFSRSYRDAFGRSPRETREAVVAGDRPLQPARLPAPPGLRPSIVDLLP